MSVNPAKKAPWRYSTSTMPSPQDHGTSSLTNTVLPKYPALLASVMFVLGYAIMVLF